MRLVGASVCAAIAILSAGPALADAPAKPDAAGEEGKAKDVADDKPARPALPEAPPRASLPWQEHAEVGGGLAIVALPSSVDGDRRPTLARLGTDVGFHIRLSWKVMEHLWFTGYLVESRHPLDLPAGSLGVPGTFAGDHAWMYTFGARLSPTLPIGSRVRLWGTAGAGWGRIEYPRLCPQEPCTGQLMIPKRAASILEIPVGGGASFEIIPRWLRLHVELTVSLFPNQQGEALEHTQTIDAAGKMIDVRPMPLLGSAVTQTIGLSLVL